MSDKLKIAKQYEDWFNNLIDQCTIGNCPAEIGVMDMKDIVPILEDYQNKYAALEAKEREIEKFKTDWNVQAAEWTIKIGGLKEENKSLRQEISQLKMKYENTGSMFSRQALELENKRLRGENESMRDELHHDAVLMAQGAGEMERLRGALEEIANWDYNGKLGRIAKQALKGGDGE